MWKHMITSMWLYSIKQLISLTQIKVKEVNEAMQESGREVCT